MPINRYVKLVVRPLALVAADQQMNWCITDRTHAETAPFTVIEHKEHTKMKPKNTICLWFNKDAHEAARFYAATFPDSEVTAVHKAPVTTRAARRAMC